MAVQIPTYEEHLQLLQSYQIGQFREGVLQPIRALNHKRKLNLGVFGFTGHGKSSLINLLLCAIKGRKESFQIVATQSGQESLNQPSSMNMVEGNRTYKEYILNEKIQISDTRGLADFALRDQEEILNYLTGRGQKGYVFREGQTAPEQRQLIEKFGEDLRSNEPADKLDGLIIVINALATDAEINSIKNFLNTLKTLTYNSYVIAITKIDKLEGNKTFQARVDSQRQKFSGLLGVDGNLIFPLYCYEREYQQRNVEETDTQALLLLKNALKQAELHFPKPVPWWTRVNNNAKKLVGKIEPYISLPWVIAIIAIIIAIIIAFICTKEKPRQILIESPNLL